ncbi:MAG TPA: glycosyltransferase family 2 protein [Thermoanaerobaculia bacterium]|nr:glycosyltransferase family 2 protein [Thermoanaerobaculia bacterium]
MEQAERSITLSIVVPVRDEAENIAAVVGEIERFRSEHPWEVEAILVDDGSRDGSWQRIAEAAASRPWLRAVRFRAGRGQTAAMAAGVHFSRGEFVTFLDADLQNDPADIPKLLEPILRDEADVVCGWRKNRHDRFWTRNVPSIVANRIIRRVLRLSVHDIGCTLKVFRREYVEGINILGEMHRFMPAYAQAQGARIAEVVVSHRARQRGESKYGLSRVGKVLVDLLTVVMLNTYGSSPAYFFGKIAAFFFFLGTVAFGIVAYRALILGRAESTPMIFIMVLLYITALLSLLSGLLAEINVRVMYQVGARKPYDVRETIGFEAAGTSGA